MITILIYPTLLDKSTKKTPILKKLVVPLEKQDIISN